MSTATNGAEKNYSDSCFKLFPLKFIRFSLKILHATRPDYVQRVENWKKKIKHTK